MTEPTFDKDGYPTDETEAAISGWDFKDPDGWLVFIGKAWNHHYGRMWNEDSLVKFATGGWSGNESVIRAMKNAHVLWSMRWKSSHRGGLYVLGFGPEPVANDGEENIQKDLALLVYRLCRAIKRQDCDNDLVDKAMDYLHRKGLGGSPLRSPLKSKELK